MLSEPQGRRPVGRRERAEQLRRWLNDDYQPAAGPNAVQRVGGAIFAATALVWTAVLTFALARQILWVLALSSRETEPGDARKGVFFYGVLLAISGTSLIVGLAATRWPVGSRLLVVVGGLMAATLAWSVLDGNTWRPTQLSLIATLAALALLAIGYGHEALTDRND